MAREDQRQFDNSWLAKEHAMWYTVILESKNRIHVSIKLPQQLPTIEKRKLHIQQHDQRQKVIPSENYYLKSV